MKDFEHLPPPAADSAVVKCIEVECRLTDGRDVLDFIESDPDFRDFIESIALTEEELAALVSTPDLSIAEIRRRSKV